MVSAHGTMGYSSGPEQKSKAYEEAAAYCKKSSKVVQTISATDTADGSLDPGFGNGGIVTSTTGVAAAGVAIQGDGKIVVIGGGEQTPNTWRLYRFLQGGDPDPSFGRVSASSTGRGVRTAGGGEPAVMFTWPLTVKLRGRPRAPD